MRSFGAKLNWTPSGLRWLGRTAVGTVLLGAGMQGVQADEVLRTLPTPNAVIYPGQVLHDEMFGDMPVSGVVPYGAIETRQQMEGHVARRTLLPGQPVTKSSIGDAKIVINGTRVLVIYQDGGLTISTYATALQSSSVGETVSVRNIDSGRTISGTVQADGSVLVGSS